MVDMSLAAEFSEMVADQADDWSDLYFVLHLPDETMLDEARLHMAPTQLERTPGTRSRFTFHVSHTRGYGCHAPLAAASLGKLDARNILGTLELERVFHSVEPNYTQGPV